jgi:DNA-binding GntR family transcriptional regulator
MQYQSALPQRRSIAGEIADSLRIAIVSADIGPNEPIRQDHIARRFDASHAPVREALRQLAAEGLVVHAVNRGTRAAPLEHDEAIEIGELRGKIEPDLARLAAGRFGSDDADRARREIARMADAGDDIATLMEANKAFHDAIYAPAGKPLATALAGQLRARYARYLVYVWRKTGHARVSSDEHAELLDMLVAGDGKAAAGFLSAHIWATTDAILPLLD